MSISSEDILEAPNISNSFTSSSCVGILGESKESLGAGVGAREGLEVEDGVPGLPSSVHFFTKSIGASSIKILPFP